MDEGHQMDEGQQWTSNLVKSITSTLNTITLHIPCAHGLLTIHHELDKQNLIHTHLAMENVNDCGLHTYSHGYYRHPDGRVIGPIFRD